MTYQLQYLRYAILYCHDCRAHVEQEISYTSASSFTADRLYCEECNAENVPTSEQIAAIRQKNMNEDSYPAFR